MCSINQYLTRIAAGALACLGLLLMSVNSMAMEIDHWRAQTSLYTVHWDPEPIHNNRSQLINIEAWLENDWLAGLALFQNSYDQSSQYLYIGKLWPIASSENFYFRLTGGLIHGYKEPYEDKIPLNELGIAPAIVPSFGVRHRRVFMEVHILGNAAAAVTAGFTFGHKSEN